MLTIKYPFVRPTVREKRAIVKTIDGHTQGPCWSNGTDWPASKQTMVLMMNIMRNVNVKQADWSILLIANLWSHWQGRVISVSTFAQAHNIITALVFHLYNADVNTTYYCLFSLSTTLFLSPLSPSQKNTFQAVLATDGHDSCL